MTLKTCCTYGLFHVIEKIYSFPARLPCDSDDCFFLMNNIVDSLDYQSNAVSRLFFMTLN